MDSLDDIRRRIDEIDSALAVLFERRMAECRRVAGIKKREGLPLSDSAREEVIERNVALVENATIREYYTDFARKLIELSKSYQQRLLDDEEEISEEGEEEGKGKESE